MTEKRISNVDKKLILKVKKSFKKYTRDHSSIRGGNFRKLTASEISRKYGI